MFGVLPEDHHGGIELKDNLPRENEKSLAEATTLFEGNISQGVRNNFFIDASSLLDESEVKDVQNNKCSDDTHVPPPFIRRKTFELDADDDKLTVLRQQYERRQGTALFQMCGEEAPSSLPVGIPHLVDNDVHTPDSLNNDGFEEVSDLRPESAPCDDDPIKSDLISPAPSPVGGCMAIHKDSIDAGSVIEDEPTHFEEKEDKIDRTVSCEVAPETAQSPMFSRRRIEYAPILSGAAPPPEPLSPELSIEEKPRNLSASSAWVVDISDIVSSPEARRKKESKSLSSSLGYFVDLKASGSVAMERSAGSSASPRDAGRKNVFFSSADKGSVESSTEKAAAQESTGIKQSAPKVVHSPEQKMFTMFIELDKEHPSDGTKERPEPSCRRKTVDEKPAAKKQPVYMFIGTESPTTNRKILDQKQHFRTKSLSTSAAAIFPDHHSQPDSIQHHTSVGNFVRLSDLDKTPRSPRGSQCTTSFTLEHKRRSWKPKTTGPNCSESLARVIPSVRDLSSTAFLGMEVEGQDDENTPKDFCEDLKHVFINSLCTDLIVEVAGRRIGAHKIVLTNRCPYFAAALSGGWVESGGNVIRLRGLSYPAVHFALYHIYAGSLTIPENMNTVELAIVCDLFHLDSLKETVEMDLAKKTCHSFHDPSSLECDCVAGVLKTLVLASSFDLEYLFPRCLRWSSTHFFKVCQTASFVSLPNELKDKILKTIVNNCDKEELTKEEALEVKVFTAVNATRLIAWAERTDLARSSLSWFHRLKDETHKVVAKAITTLLFNTSSFHLLVRDTVDSVLTYSSRFSTPEELCLVYRVLMLLRIEDDYSRYPEGAKFVLENLLDCVISQLVLQASKVVRSRAWYLLDDGMQIPILDKAGLPRRRHDGPLQRSATDDKSFPRKERLPGGALGLGAASSGLILPGGNRLQNLRQVKQVIAQHVNRANQGTLDPVPLRRSAVPVATTVKRQEVKSRYLEIKPTLKTKTAAASVGLRHSYCAPATATSSDSSVVTPPEWTSEAATACVTTTDTTASAASIAATAPTNVTAAASHKRKGRPTSAPLRQINLPRRCASSSAVPAKDRLSAPPAMVAAVPSQTKRASTSSTSTSASASASVPTSATTSFSTKKLTAPMSRLNIPLRTCRSSSSVPQTSSVATRTDLLKTGENASRTKSPTQAKSKAAPLKPVNGPRDRFGPVAPPKRLNGLANKPGTRTVGCEPSDLSSKSKTRAPIAAVRVRNGGASTSNKSTRDKSTRVKSTSVKSTSDMATDTSDIPTTPHDGDTPCSKSIVLASRSGTFLKDEPTVLRKTVES